MSFFRRYCVHCGKLTSSTTAVLSKGGQAGSGDEWDWKKAYEAKIRENERRALASMKITGVSIEDSNTNRRDVEAETKLRSAISSVLWDQRVEDQNKGINRGFTLSPATATTSKYLENQSSSELEQTRISAALLEVGQAVRNLESRRPGWCHMMMGGIAETHDIEEQQVQTLFDLWLQNDAESKEDD